ncbi:Nitrate/nitrite response regulator protein [hydrothermal vent metagenome]|uniref:Nitrate/nitrite response regulator protein n=1 Tax=hydrothermal vent metagenome TaxID=652676 RepID=A0A3B1B2S1_9ZZZZ
MNNNINSILIIDDHPLLRRGISNLVSMDQSFKVIAEASNGTEGLQLALTLNPDIILLDLNMEVMDGLQTLKAIKASELESRVVILTVSDNEKDVVATLRAGADGYLLKDMEPEDMLARLHQVIEGQIILSDKVSDLVVRGLHEESRDSVKLTDREDETLALIAKGRSNKLIARELNIVESTVKVHVKHLLRKLKLRNRLEAAIWAIEKNK